MPFGRLERTPGPLPMSDINVTPLVDVMLVLVVIFIITAPLLATSIRLDLPRTSAGTPSDAPGFLSVALTADGRLFLNEKQVPAAQLTAALAQAARQNPATEIQLRADQAVPYGRIVEIMGMVHQAGLNRIGFVTEAPKK
jgi:biopolymer transport protein ExbD